MLAKNKLLEEIAARLGEYQPDWNFILDIYKDIARAKGKKARRWKHQNFHTLISESYLRAALLTICRDYQERAIVEPISCPTESANYRFIRGRWHKAVRVLRKEDGSTITDMDAILNVDSLPIRVEIKLVRNGAACPELTKLITEPGLSESLDPLCEYFNTNQAGFMLVLYYAAANATNSPHRNSFTERGGLVVPFYANYGGYQRDLKRIVEEHHLLEV